MVVCTGDKGPVVSMAAIQRPLPLPPVAGLGEAGEPAARLLENFFTFILAAQILNLSPGSLW